MIFNFYAGQILKINRELMVFSHNGDIVTLTQDDILVVYEEISFVSARAIRLNDSAHVHIFMDSFVESIEPYSSRSSTFADLFRELD
jgi:hypothetical protein